MFEWIVFLSAMVVLLLILGIGGAIIDWVIPDDETEDFE